MLLREFDARAGWNNGFLSCAHWLHWCTGIDLGACREKVRVARALATSCCCAGVGIAHGHAAGLGGTRFDLTWAIDVLWRRNASAQLGA